ncbi:MAG: hypothetical protein IBX63_05300 [Coriobacteriia bacterium]|nr:hypothetical protein [Coriobacteriia bacterium]
MPRILYVTSALEEWIDVARMMRSQRSWEPVYWVTVRGNRDLVREAFPDCINHWFMDAVRGIPAPELAGLAVPALDVESLTRLRYHQSVAIQMMDRLDSGSAFAYRERLRHYHRLLQYWTAVLDSVAPDLAVFASTPHLVTDYVLYAVCRTRRVHTLILTPTALPHTVMLREDIDSPPLRLESSQPQVHGQDVPRAQAAVEAHLSRLRGDYEDAIPDYMLRVADSHRRPQAYGRHRLSKLLRIDRYPRYARSTIQFIASLPSRQRARREVHGYCYLKIPEVRYEDSWMTHEQIEAYRRTAKVGLARLAQAYRDACSRSAAPADAPYVYMPLHYQPERTTCPEGGDFSRQYLLAHMLSENLPEGWVLRVREHPSQLTTVLAGNQGRSPDDYEDFISLPCVHLVRLGESPFGLIDGARAVVTVSGTAGWEAVVRGKPAVVFGTPWYSRCPGVYRVSTAGALRDVLADIRQGADPSQEAVNTFAVDCWLNGYRADLNRDDSSALSRAANGRGLARALTRFDDELLGGWAAG